MRPLKSLSLSTLIKKLSAAFRRMPDERAPERVSYGLHDTLLSGLAMFFFQHRSLLQFQERLKQRLGRCNLETIFQVTAVPSDTQMRTILDQGEPVLLRQQLGGLFEEMRRAGWAQQYRTSVPDGPDAGSYYTLVLDGVQYFNSSNVQCERCLTKTNKKTGRVQYSHSVVSGTLVKAGAHRIFPLDVEEVCQQDGALKQDCEINAAKRLLPRFRREHPQLKVIVAGDDLYAHEPLVELLGELRLRFVLVAKPESHQELFDRVADLERLGAVQHGTWQEGPWCKRRYFEYRFAKQLPLKAGGAVAVNFLEVWERDQAGQALYHNSWVTDLAITHTNVASLIQIGRSRWKIENEQFNIQKNHGYELEHNYGHGEKNLSLMFYLLNLLAFALHLILAAGDRLYQQCRQQETLQETWHILRTLMRTELFASWEAMLTKFILSGQRGP